MRLAFLFLRVGVMNEMQYRANFFVQLLQSIAVTGSGLVALALVYSHTDNLDGWTHPQLRALMGVFTMVLGLVGFVVEPNMTRLMGDVRQGTLDLVLTKPADSQLLVSLREFRVWSLTDVLVGLAVLIWGIVGFERGVGWSEAAGFLVTLLAGGVMIYCFWLILTTGAFWFVRMEMVQEMFTGLVRAGQYPVGIYPAWLRYGLTFVAPLGFAITVPVEALTGRMSAGRFAVAIGFGVALAVVTRLIWRVGLRRYSGASA
jgi:ABC-2 type transport system permease protein